MSPVIEVPMDVGRPVTHRPKEPQAMDESGLSQLIERVGKTFYPVSPANDE